MIQNKTHLSPVGFTAGALCLLAVLTLPGCGNNAETAGTSAPPPPQSVSVITIEPQLIPQTIVLPGRIEACRQAQVRPQVDGIITQRLFKEGSVVEKGQQLYQIDDARYKAALESAQANLQSSRSNASSAGALARRYGELVNIEAVSRQEYDDARARSDQATAAVAVDEAAVEVARVNFDYTKVEAPISGRIGRSLVTEGALVTANQDQPLAVITQLDPVFVDLQQSGSRLNEMRHRVRDPDQVSVTLYPEDKEGPYGHKGTLKFSEVTIAELTGSVTLRASVPNPDRVLLPGLFVRAELDLGKREVLLVPQRAAIRTPDGKLTVWLLDSDNQAQPHPVTAQNAFEDQWIVTGGLSAGDRVIVEGYQKIAAGAVVAPSPWTPAAASTSLTDQD